MTIVNIILLFLFYFFDNQQVTSFKEGDIIFQTSKGSLSKAIQLATQSDYSHVGIIFYHENQYVVLEAVQPVKITPLQQWIRRGEREHYVVKRLKNADRILTKSVVSNMKEEGKRYIGKNYDIYFQWSDEALYCSELVWKIYKKTTGLGLGQLKELKEFDLEPFVVKQKLKEHYGQDIPLLEKIISPDAIFKSDLLETISPQ